MPAFAYLIFDDVVLINYLPLGANLMLRNFNIVTKCRGVPAWTYSGRYLYAPTQRQKIAVGLIYSIFNNIPDIGWIFGYSPFPTSKTAMSINCPDPFVQELSFCPVSLGILSFGFEDKKVIGF